MEFPRCWQPSPAFLLSLAILLCATHALLALGASTSHCSTHDEPAHIVAGYTYNQLGDFRLQPENGILTQRLIALPLAWEKVHAVNTSSPAFDNSDVWEISRQFFYHSGNTADLLLFSGRAMIALLSAGLGMLIFFTTRRLFGITAAFISLTAYCFSPDTLAHGALATSDISATFFILLAVLAWWRLLEAPSVLRLLASGLCFGMAATAKFSAVLLLPIAGILAIVHFWLTTTAMRSGFARRMAIAFIFHVGVAMLWIWALYNFRFSAFNPELGTGTATFYRDWTSIRTDLGPTGQALNLLRNWHILPEAYLYGFGFVLDLAQSRAAFLNGEFSTTGWVQFFPYAFAVKTAMPLLLLFGGGLWGVTHFAQRGSWRTVIKQTAPLLALFGVFWLSALTSHLNIGVRHLLPTYPTLFVLAGSIVFVNSRPWVTGLLCALTIGSLLLVSTFQRPNYLSYFNNLAGGTNQGWAHLVDSSLDWGQDLPALQRWLAANNTGAEPVYLSYFGTGNATYEGIKATTLPSSPEWEKSRPWYWLHPGYYCISATNLQLVYFPVAGQWTIKMDHLFNNLRRMTPSFRLFAANAQAREAFLKAKPLQDWEAAWHSYDLLRFARLCHFLRLRTPTANIGGSILVYHLTADDIQHAFPAQPSEAAPAKAH